MLDTIYDRMLGDVDRMLKLDDEDSFTWALDAACALARRGMLDELAGQLDCDAPGSIPVEDSYPGRGFLERLEAEELDGTESFVRAAALAVCAVEIGDPVFSKVLDRLALGTGSKASTAGLFLLCISGATADTRRRIITAELALASAIAAEGGDAWRNTVQWILTTGGEEADPSDAAVDALECVERARQHRAAEVILAALAPDWSGSLDELIDTAINLAAQGVGEGDAGVESGDATTGEAGDGGGDAGADGQ